MAHSFPAIRGARGRRRGFHRRGLAPLCLLAWFPRALAQDIIVSPPATPATPAAVQDYQAGNPMQVFTTPGEIPSPIPLQWGLANAHPHLDYQFLYGNGIESSPGHQQASLVQKLAPGTLITIGEHWTLDYTPTLTFYSSRNFQDTVDQSVHLSWGQSYGNDWFLNGSQCYAASTDPEIETGVQTHREIYATDFNASYQINTKISLDLGVNQTLNYVRNGGSATNVVSNLAFADSRGWSTLDWLNYEFWSRFNAGVGVGLGYDQLEGSPDSIYEQYQGRVNWRATDKISFQLSGGLHDQQYLSGNAGAIVTPIFGAAVQYQPFEHTELNLSGSRTVSTSAFQSQMIENTVVSAGLSQRLLKRLHLDVTGSYGTTKYVASASGFGSHRVDDLWSINARLGCSLLKRGTIGVFYAYTDNASRQAGFAAGGSAYAFASNQVGFEIAYRY